MWRSPMVSEWLEADIKGRLHRLLLLVEQYHHEPTAALDAQICRNESALGLSPMDRRRLQWTIEKTEQEQRRRPPQTPPASKSEMRELLQVLG